MGYSNLQFLPNIKQGHERTRVGEIANFLPKEKVPPYFWQLQKKFSRGTQYNKLENCFFALKLIGKDVYGVYSGAKLLDHFSREIENCYQILIVINRDWHELYDEISTRTPIIPTPASKIFRFVYITEAGINYITSACDHLAKYFFLMLFNQVDGCLQTQHQDKELRRRREYFHNFVEYIIGKNGPKEIKKFEDLSNIFRTWADQLAIVKDIRNFEQHTGRLSPVYWYEQQKLRLDFACIKIQPPFNNNELLPFEKLAGLIPSYDGLMRDIRIWYENYLKYLNL